MNYLLYVMLRLPAKSSRKALPVKETVGEEIESDQATDQFVSFLFTRSYS